MSLLNKINGVREIWKFDNRFEILRKRLFGNQSSINYRIGDLDFTVDHDAGDANGAREVIATDMYRQFFPFLDLAGPLNVLDIGANNGGFGLLLKYEQIAIKKYVGVEFNPATFMRLKFNIERNITVAEIDPRCSHDKVVSHRTDLVRGRPWRLVSALTEERNP